MAPPQEWACCRTSRCRESFHSAFARSEPGNAQAERIGRAPGTAGTFQKTPVALATINHSFRRLAAHPERDSQACKRTSAKFSSALATQGHLAERRRICAPQGGHPGRNHETTVKFCVFWCGSWAQRSVAATYLFSVCCSRPSAIEHVKTNEMGIRFTHPAATSCGFRLSSAPAIVVW
jgi:hypothetical protein